MNSSPVTIKIRYFASLRDARGIAEEVRSTQTLKAIDLYQELRSEYGFRLDPHELRVAINGRFSSMESELRAGDELAFIPPVSGG